MPHLRILLLDGVSSDTMLRGFHLPRLAMLSWRNAAGPLLSIDLKVVDSVAVLDLLRTDGHERRACSMQACFPLKCDISRAFAIQA